MVGRAVGASLRFALRPRFGTFSRGIVFSISNGRLFIRFIVTRIRSFDSSEPERQWQFGGSEWGNRHLCDRKSTYDPANASTSFGTLI